MPFTVVVATACPDRYRGFLTSVMPEVSPGVYVSPDLSKAVRERIVAVFEDWWPSMPGSSLTVIWRDSSQPGELGLRTLGSPRRELVELDGALLLRRAGPSDA